MESGRRGGRDSLRPLSLGLTSVRLIVSRLEADAARALDDQPANQLVKYDPAAHHDAPLDQSRETVVTRLLINLAVALSKCIPSVTFGNFGLISVLVGYLAPNMITYLVVYPFCRLVFGTLYPAYASYKAVRTKNLKEYVKWMMYWIVFALFTCTETFTDVFLSWFPFYYEVKIVLVLWLLSPATKGSSILYRKFVHPALCRREQEIDEYIAKAKDQGYHTVLNLGTKGVNYATTVIMQTAIKGGGGLVQQLRKSYSLSDLSECEPRDERADEADDVLSEPQLIRRNVARSGYNTRRSASESSRSMYFSEAGSDEPDLSHIKSSEDISSGYSSADNSASLARTGSLGRTRPRPRTQVTSVKRPAAAEGSEVTIEELLDDDLEYTSMPPLMNVPSPLFLSHSDPPFIYQYVGDQVRIVQVLGGNPLFDNIATKNLNQVKQDLNEFIQSVEEKIDNKLDIRDVTEVKSQIDVKTAPDTEVSVSQVDIVADEPFYEIDNNNNDVENKPNVLHGDNNETITTETSAEIQNNDVKEADSKIVDINSATKVEDISDTIEQVEKKTSEVNEDITLVSLASDENKEAFETNSLDTSLYEAETAESDDEASFGTPEDSPRAKRKSPRGRYGKGKAPPPPKDEIKLDTKDVRPSEMNATESKESLVDIVNSLSSTALKDVVATNSLVVNPIYEKKRRQKSKSPNRLAKASSIGKLLQLPGKLAFWHKNDSKSKEERDSASVSSNDPSRRSSLIEKFNDAETIEVLDLVEEYNTQIIPVKADDQISFKDASSDVESEVMGHNIMEKSDALQKLIEAKIESHPEYKITVVAVEIPSPSKSTDV